MRFAWTAVLTITLCAASDSHAQKASAALAGPPMGWNSWDAYGLTITEAQFRANVEVLKTKLKPFGWSYAVIDEGWFFFNPQDREKPDTLKYALDTNGRYVPVPERFPSAGPEPMVAPDIKAANSAPPKFSVEIERTSFKPLGDWVHAQGLKFGIHIVRGIPRASVERNLPIANSSFHTQDAADTTDACPWDPTNWGVKDNAAGQAWYDSLLRQYAGWGVDLLKVDCISDHPYKADEIRMIRRAIDKTGRPMVLSLSPGPTNPSHAAEVDKLATMWRISDDVWDLWQTAPGTQFPQSIRGQFDRAAQWLPLTLNHFPDLDMLAFGELRPSPGWGAPRHSRLTLEEERTQITLWAIMHSPLILGANLTLLDDATLKLLTKKEVLLLDRSSQLTVVNGEPTQHDRPLDVSGVSPIVLSGWVRHDPAADDVDVYYAFFNLGDKPLEFDRSFNELNEAPPGAKTMTDNLFDVWSGLDLGQVSRIHITIPPHGVVLMEAH